MRDDLGSTGPTTHTVRRGATARTRALALTAALAPALLVAACSSGGPATEGGRTPDDGGASGATDGSVIVAPTEEEACATAKEEGQTEVSYRSATDADQFQQETAGFREKYPWMKVTFTNMTPIDSVQNVLAQVQTGHALDVDANDLDPVNARTIFEAGAAQSVDWSGSGVQEDTLMTLSGVSTFRSTRNPMGIGYSTERYTADDLPDTWEELVDPAYAGKVSYDPRATFLAGLALAWGKDKTLDWYGRFLDVDAAVANLGISSSLQAAASGELPISTTATASEVAQMQEAGVPIAIKYLDVVPTQETYEVLYKDAPHPDAALCFLAWFGSTDGGLAALEKVEHRPTGAEPEGLPVGAQLVFASTGEDLDLLTDVAQSMVELQPAS